MGYCSVWMQFWLREGFPPSGDFGCVSHAALYIVPTYHNSVVTRLGFAHYIARFIHVWTGHCKYALLQGI